MHSVTIFFISKTKFDSKIWHNGSITQYASKTTVQNFSLKMEYEKNVDFKGSACLPVVETFKVFQNIGYWSLPSATFENLDMMMVKILVPYANVLITH